MKPILSVLLALMLCLSLCACGKQPVETPTEPPTGPSVPVSTCPPAPTEPPTEPPTEAPTEPEVPEIVFAATDEAFTDGENTLLTLSAGLPSCETLPQVDAYYKALYDDLRALCDLNAQDAAQRRAEFITDGLDFTPWAVEVDCEITRNDGVTLSVLREIYENTGGAHPLITYQSETFDVASQGRLLLGDLFTVAEEEYLPRLRDMMVARMDQLETEGVVLYYDFAREQLTELLDPMDFALTEDSLLLFFDVYALAPYAAGPQQFYLPLTDLADILKPQYQVK
ncbi:MAG: DUF3298 domain-containing protein [Clostridia bacterium]|nr:DUF3298 domain-containing protein [Clostridia bacterium]